MTTDPPPAAAEGRGQAVADTLEMGKVVDLPAGSEVAPKGEGVSSLRTGRPLFNRRPCLLPVTSDTAICLSRAAGRRRGASTPGGLVRRHRG